MKQSGKRCGKWT